MPHNRRLHLLLLGLLLAVGAALRLAHLGEPSLWWDEFITLGVAQLPVDRMLHTLTVIGPSDFGGEFFPPLTHLITHAVLEFSRSDAVLRLVSVVAGTAALYALYALAAAVFSRPAGLFAAALAALSVYQIHYSRELRPYSLFLLLSLLSFLALYRALTQGGLRRHVLYILATVAMCYASYMAFSNIAAQGLFTVFFLGRSLAVREFDLRRAVRKGLALAGAVAVVGLCYTPWLPAYANIFALLKSGGGSPGVPDGFLWSTLSEFGAYAAAKHGLPWLPLVLLGLLGGAVALRPRYRVGLALFGFFAAMPLVAFLAAGTKLEINSRYVFNAFYCLLALAGLGVAFVVEKTLAHLRLSQARTAWAAPLAGLVVCLGVNAPNLTSLSAYYLRETSYSKELADYLVWNKNAVTHLLFQSPRNPKLITDWYLPDVFENFSSYVPKGYKRAFHLVQSDQKPATGPYPPRFLATVQDTTVYAMGLVSTAPVVLTPDREGQARYLDDFTTYRFYTDCDQTENLAPETRYHTLTHYAFEKPGYVLYRFVAAPGTRLTRARLTLDFAAAFLAGVPSDSRVVVSVAVDDAPFQEIDAVTGETFLGPDGRLVPADAKNRRRVSRAYDIAGLESRANAVRLRLDYGPVANPGVIEATRIELAADLAGRPTGPDPAAAALERAAGHNTLAAWRPGEALIDADALYAFAARDDIPAGPANPASALPGFLAAHPGLEPVFAIPDADGSPAYVFYDPALTDPFVRLGPEQGRQARLGRTPPLEIGAVKLEGALNRPRLRVGDASLSVPVLAPPPTTLLLDRKGVGVLRFEPSFAREDEALAAFPLAFNMQKNEGEDCLSCKAPGPCSVTVPLHSAYPITLLRVLSYPRVYADKAGKNMVRVSFSPDGENFTALDVLRSNRSGLWEGLMARRVAVLRFKNPIQDGFVRFDLSGPGAQIWSRDATRMRIEAVLDATSFPGLTLTEETFPLALTDNGGAPLGLFLSPAPLPYLPGLQDDF